MENGPNRAAFWVNFITEQCEYPAPTLLRDQLVHATFEEFCPCGCNSFEVRVQSGCAAAQGRRQKAALAFCPPVGLTVLEGIEHIAVGHAAAQVPERPQPHAPAAKIAAVICEAQAAGADQAE